MELFRGAYVLMALVLFSRPAPAESERPANLLTQGGFEQDGAGWRVDAQLKRTDEPDVAHRGRACLTGEVTKPNQALRLKRDVRVRAGNRYDFAMWVRATNRTKAVLWAVLPGEKERTMVASWPKLAKKWQLCRCAINVKQAGILHLEIIVPSSYGGPAGRIWVDDVALLETEMPPVAVVSTGKGFCDEPTMAMAADGSVYIAYNQFTDGWDSLRITRLRAEKNGQFTTLGRWQVEGGPGTYVLGPRLVASGQDVTLVFAAEHKKNWDVMAVTCGPNGPGKRMQVSSHPAVDVDPVAAWYDGTLWIAWESNRDGNHQIIATAVGDDQVEPPRVVSPSGVSAYDPSLAILANGEVCVAWHTFVHGNADIYLSRCVANDKWSSAVRLTHAPTIDRHVFLFTRADQLWMVYENAQVKTYHVGATNERRLIVAQVTAKGLRAPVVHGRSPLAGRCEAGDAQFDSDGRIWLAMLRPRLPRAGWDVHLTRFADGHWDKPSPISSGKGMDRLPALAVCDEQVLVAFQVDDIPNSWADVDSTSKATSRICLASVRADRVSSGETPELQPLVEPAETFDAATIRNERGEELPTSTIQYQGQTLQLFFGDLHEHSDISVCNRVGDQSLDESYQHMRDLACYDFVCVTDHGYNMNRYYWNYSAKWARANDDPERFVPFLGQEWTSSTERYSKQHPYGFYGHRNLILADLYFPKWWNSRNLQTPAQVWDDLHRLHANFVHIPHQLADTGNVPTDWSFHDEKAQPVAEIFQTRGSYEYFGAPRQALRTIPGPGSFMQDAWAMGIVIGVIASPDHGGGYGKACVFAPELTRESILDALRARHCYGTTAAKIFLDVRVDGHLMGEKICQPASKPVTIDVHVRCPAPIDRIEVCRSNQFIDAKRPGGTETHVTFVDREPLPEPSYYYVRVIQKDEEIAWSSPVWFGTAKQR